MSLRRSSALAVVLLLLFFAINGYIQSSKNGRALKRADQDRSNLISSLSFQTKELNKLQTLITKQNHKLVKAGFKVVHIPGENTTTFLPPTSNPSPQPEPSKSHHPKPRHKPTPKPTPSPRPRPKPSPSPTPGPVPGIKDTICKLTGICALTYSFYLF